MMPHMRVGSVAQAHKIKPVSLLVMIGHIMQGRETRDVRDIFLSCTYTFTLFDHKYGQEQLNETFAS